MPLFLLRHKFYEQFHCRADPLVAVMSAYRMDLCRARAYWKFHKAAGIQFFLHSESGQKRKTVAVHYQILDGGDTPKLCYLIQADIILLQPCFEYLPENTVGLIDHKRDRDLSLCQKTAETRCKTRRHDK